MQFNGTNCHNQVSSIIATNGVRFSISIHTQIQTHHQVYLQVFHFIRNEADFEYEKKTSERNSNKGPNRKQEATIEM